MLKTLRNRRAIGGFAMGLGSCIALSGGFYNRTGRDAGTTDREMLQRDWQVFGSDMRTAATKIMAKDDK